ncbi:MBL fold metallo-hydrolase [Limoniibacter endophyticus]|uniref:MBL fold metallo-hydrolase n=1 Tax=Limoniibacter endophyticus TaxID=1565040 RepID=A0A8J3DI48_9HYPH|nr:MBL fold metallo-hydrolase [Limoniibacter endophyticus]GHC70210.1 MBL fold metallo-hydrolase [Limoniibacter endophyticus]
MKIGLQGGFGEKGRTSVSVSSGGKTIMLDAGIKVGAQGEEYYPRLIKPIGAYDAILISHAHEDHIGAMARLVALGYRGAFYMTAETLAEAQATLDQYADTQDLAGFALANTKITLFAPGETLKFGDMTVSTGLSGHVVGGVWFAVEAKRKRIVYSADIVPKSAVFRMDPMPLCDLLILDASYGADPVSAQERAAQIADWVTARQGGCLLPTPLSGRSIELIAALDMQFAIHSGMRDPLRRQIEAEDALVAGIAPMLGERLANARNWEVDEALPDCPLLVHDGMGVAGPAADAIRAAQTGDYPILLSGHLPAGSPGALLKASGRADWIRMPTHPTLPEAMALWQRAGRPDLLAHSCDETMLAELGQHIDGLDISARTGQIITV